MTSYIRPVNESEMMPHASKRGLSQKRNYYNSDKRLHDAIKGQNIIEHKPLVKQLYFDLLKRDGAQPKASNESSSNQIQLAKELFFDLLKRDSSNTTQAPRNKNADLNNHLLMAKELFFNLLKCDNGLPFDLSI